MKLELGVVGRVLMKGSKQGVKDPTKTYYNLSLGQNGECDTFNCPQEVFDAVQEGKEYAFKCSFNTQYPLSGIRLMELVPVSGAK